MNFTKLQGTGNDFILIDGINTAIDLNVLKETSRRLCDRHFGIGADGVIVVLPSSNADLRMVIYNADGSEAEMCGNGIRCFAFFALIEKLVSKKTFTVETLAGIMGPEIIKSTDNKALVKINMGKPFLKANEIPVNVAGNEPHLNIPVAVNEQNYSVTAIGMGNPHAVIFVDKVKDFPVTTIGPLIENHSLFPKRTNVEFLEILSKKEANMRVWERGAAETLACGTGTCASVVAGNLHGKLDEKVTVHLLGGDLEIEWQNKQNIFMTGPAVIVFKGTFSL